MFRCDVMRKPGTHTVLDYNILSEVFKKNANTSALCNICICMCSQRSSTELLQKVCEVVERGLMALEKGAGTLLPQDCSAITDSAFMQVGS